MCEEMKVLKILKKDYELFNTALENNDVSLIRDESCSSEVEYMNETVEFDDGSTINITVWGELGVQCSVYFNGPNNVSNMDGWEQCVESDEGFDCLYRFEFNSKQYTLKLEVE